jgi:hypothetical protein
MDESSQCCIVVSREQALIDVLKEQGERLVVAGEEEQAIDAVRANPEQPILVDVAEFLNWPKLLRMREDDECRPGVVIGYAPPIRQDLLETAELFCDEVVPRPTIMRRLAPLLERVRAEPQSEASSGGCC